MMRAEVREFVALLAISLSVLAVFVLWAEVDAVGLLRLCREDGIVENLSAALFGLSGTCFLVILRRSDFIRTKEYGLRYMMCGAWALLMFVFMGEEISWGQRILDIETPALMNEINYQQEINIHNIKGLMGDPYTYVSIMMIATGFLLPVMALLPLGKKIFQWLAFPVASLACMPLFVGAYLFGKYYHGLLLHPYDGAAEVRELLFAVGLFVFAFHGAMRPWALFRLKSPAMTS